MPNMLKSWKDFASIEDWIANTQVADTSVGEATMISQPMISSENKVNECDINRQRPIIQWQEKVGLLLFRWSKEKGFTSTGALCVVTHAYIEGATSANFRERAYKTNNWWNIRAIKNKGQESCGGRFACFKSLQESFSAYYNRLTTEPDLQEFNNPNFNPSYPDLGLLFSRIPEQLPTEQEILDALRIEANNEAGSYAYDPNNIKYGERLRSTIQTVRTDIFEYTNFKLSCYRIPYEKLLNDQIVLMQKLIANPDIAQQLSICTNLISDFEKKIAELEQIKTLVNETRTIF